MKEQGGKDKPREAELKSEDGDVRQVRGYSVDNYLTLASAGVGRPKQVPAGPSLPKVVDDDNEIRRARTVNWGHPEEFLRVESDDKTVAILWTTKLSLSALMLSISKSAQLRDDEPATVAIDRAGHTAYKEVAAITLLDSDANQGIASAEVPFKGFWLWWALESREDHAYSEASINYSRTDLASANGTLAKRTDEFVASTGTADVVSGARAALSRLRELEII